DPSGVAAVLGSITTATIEIQADDSTSPTLDILSPVAGSTTVLQTPTMAVSGTASDEHGIEHVTVALNGNSPVDAALSAPSGSSVPWSVDVSPVTGSNTMVVTAYDVRGNFPSLSRSFTVVRQNTLTISRSVPGGVAVDTAGTIALTATPAANA